MTTATFHFLQTHLCLGSCSSTYPFQLCLFASATTFLSSTAILLTLFNTCPLALLSTRPNLHELCYSHLPKYLQSSFHLSVFISYLTKQWWAQLLALQEHITCERVQSQSLHGQIASPLQTLWETENSSKFFLTWYTLFWREGLTGHLNIRFLILKY